MIDKSFKRFLLQCHHPISQMFLLASRPASYTRKMEITKNVSDGSGQNIPAKKLMDAKVRPQLLKEYLEPMPAIQADDPFGFEKTLTVEDLFKARVHFGHKIGTLNENMKWAIYGERLGICIFDLDITRQYMIRALNFIATLSYCGGRFLFITNNKYAMEMVEEKAATLGEYSQNRYWHRGTFTNVRVPGGPIRTPDALIFLNILKTQMLERHPAIIEAAKMCIPTVGIVDSNCEPNLISYPIPGNDDTPSSMNFYMNKFAEAILLGRKMRKEKKELMKMPPNARPNFRPRY